MNYRILFIALAPPDFYRNPLIPGCDQLFIGPDVIKENFNGCSGSVKLTPHLYDGKCLSQYLRSINFTPDYVIIKADSTMRSHIKRVKFIPGVKLLLVGDTHHMSNPIINMIDYSLSEDWDFIASEHDLHHHSLFIEAGVTNLLNLPCFSINPIKHNPLHLSAPSTVFVGSLSPSHWYRYFLVNKLSHQSIGFKSISCSQLEASFIYQKSYISLNISLNSDFNYRIFEIIASGGCLLTDRLGPDSLLSECLEEGTHYFAYSSYTELIDTIRFLYENHHIRNRVAADAFHHYWDNLSPQHYSHQFLKAVSLKTSMSSL